MSQSLEEFVEEMRVALGAFEQDYRQKAKECPESYPLLMEDGNEGLWFEFFEEGHWND